MPDPINPTNPTGPPTTSSGYIIGSQDPLSPYYQGTSYWGGRTPQNFTPSGSSDGRVTSGGYTVGSQNPNSPYYQGSSYWGGSADGGGRYLANEFQREMVSRGHYSTSPGNRGMYPGSDGTVRGQTLAGPINQGAAPPSSGRTVNPGRAVNPRIPRVPRISPGTLARGAADFGIGIAGEAVIDAAWDKVAPDREERYRERTQDPRPLRPRSGEISAGVNAVAAGGTMGIIGVAAAAAARHLAPDDTDPGNPKGIIGRALGWNDQYPSQTDPDALGQGPQTEAPRPAQPGEPGSVAGAIYTVQWRSTLFGGAQFVSDGLTNGDPRLLGPVSSQSIETFYPSGQISARIRRFIAADGRTVNYTIENFFGDGTPATTNGSGSLVRADGGTDPPAAPEQPAVYAPNPARRSRPTSPGGVPNLLPPAPTPNYPNFDPAGDTPWPGTEPAYPPDTQPIAPAPATPPNFQPSAPAGEPNTPTNPNAPPGRPDLDPNAPPRPAPDLATDPDTPARGAGLGAEQKTGPQLPRTYELPDGTRITDNPDGSRTIDSPTDSPWLDELHNPTRPLIPPVLPVPVPVGQVQPVRTPSSPRLTSNPADNPNVQRIQEPVRQTPPESPKGTCFYEFQRVADIQRKATSTEERAANPTSGFTGLYGIGIESRLKLGETFTLLQTVNQFMRKAWEMTRMDKVLNLLTFIGVMHNVSMLSRDVGETFFQLIGQGIQAAGIRDEEGGVIDVPQVVGDATESFLRRVLGSDVYDGIRDTWNKANRIISSASAIIWTVRSIADSSLDLMEWIGEHTGRIGNALKRWGVVGERAYPWMSEKPRALPKGRRWLDRATGALETVEGSLSVFQQGASSVIEVQEEIQETGEAIDRFSASILDAVPDPWLDNGPVKNAHDARKAASDGPDVPPSEAQKG